MDHKPINLDQLAVLTGLRDQVDARLKLLTDIDKIWQPTDFLPDLTGDDWQDKIQDLRASARNISDELLVVLVGDMVTEEALPNYSVSLNIMARDNLGDDVHPWALWLRGWTAEENRHGDLLNAYLRLTGRVDMRSVEVTVHYLITRGFNPQTYPDPYNGLIYTSFQERATRVSHQNVAKLAAQQGDANLANMCSRIAGDEARHAMFYGDMMGHVIDQDPQGGILAFRTMMKTLIAMPGRHMYDGVEPSLFDKFSVVAQRTGVYTIFDYAEIIEHLVEKWRIGERSVSGPAAKAQEYLCRQPARYRSLAEQVSQIVKDQPASKFSWIHGRQA
jgi:acyl-[acyl-carrier-protein] desaturase